MTVLGGQVVFERGVVAPRPLGAELIFLGA
jgi:hypothetical protein